ncbi:twin-arginine translocation signal domain-containing protein [Arthrobacter alpinus]|nr:twin-arginine translocation signal domain-containing protein [Arthrobacter alpinus]
MTEITPAADKVSRRRFLSGSAAVAGAGGWFWAPPEVRLLPPPRRPSRSPKKSAWPSGRR